MVDIVCTATVHITGTHSLVSLVKDTVEKHIIAREKPNKRYKLRNKFKPIYMPPLLKWGPKYENILQCPIMNKNKVNYICGHIDHSNIDLIKDISKHTRIITTCRDPLLTLIGIKRRNKPPLQNIEYEKHKHLHNRMAHTLVCWELWATEFYELDPFIIPLDINSNIKYDIFDFSKMKVENSRGDYPLKQAYYDKNLDYIKNEIGEEFNALVGLGNTLRPVLEKIGYKDLLWW